MILIMKPQTGPPKFKKQALSACFLNLGNSWKLIDLKKTHQFGKTPRFEKTSRFKGQQFEIF